jgi:exodeoxyribonuclease VII large subunit
MATADDRTMSGAALQGDSAIVELPPGTLSVHQLTNHIQLALNDAFREPVWVAGEMSGKKAVNGAVYFDLLDRPDPNSPPSAKIKVVCKKAVAARVGQQTREAGVRLEDGIPVRLCGRLAVWPKTGSYQLDLVDVDAPWTLGQQVANRDRILELLRQEGVLDRNARLDVPTMPMRVAVITSPGSHAEADFRTSLEASGYGFSVNIFPALVQGPEAPAQIEAAFRWVEAYRQAHRWRPDIVVCVRGGGARSDLAAWDDPAVARAIAASPYPVMVAVGHELDSSIADAAAMVSVKTPTAAAAWLVEAVAANLQRVDDARLRLERLAVLFCNRADQAVSAQRARVSPAALSSLARVTADTTRARSQVSSGAARLLDRAARDVDMPASKVAPAACSTLDWASASLDLATAQARSADPARILARGFSVTRTATGVLVTDPDEVSDGTELVSQLAQGSLRSIAARMHPPRTPARSDS